MSSSQVKSVLLSRTMTANEVKRKSLLIITGQQYIDNLLEHVQPNKILRAKYENQVFDLKASEVKTKQNRQLQIQKTSTFFNALDMQATDQLVFWLSTEGEVHVSVIRLLYEIYFQVREKDNNQSTTLPMFEDQIYVRKIVATQEEIKPGEQFTKPHHLDFSPTDTQVFESLGVPTEGKFCVIDDNNQKHLFQTRYDTGRNKFSWYGTSTYMISHKINPGDALVLWKDEDLDFMRLTLVRRSSFDMTEHLISFLDSEKNKKSGDQQQAGEQQVEQAKEVQEDGASNGNQHDIQESNSLQQQQGGDANIQVELGKREGEEILQQDETKKAKVDGVPTEQA